MADARGARTRRLPGPISAIVLACSTGGCGGATPLLHPAHTLAPGEVTLGAGVSGSFLAGDARTRLEEARAVTTSGGAPAPDDQAALTDGTVISVLATPGAAPWISGRVGVAEHTEAGAGYTGRWARIDVRHALEDRKLALSFGIALLGLLPHPSADGKEPTGSSGAIAGVDASGAAGWGVDLPVIVGYRSEAELVQVWGGLRGSFEQTFGTVVLDTDWPAPSDPGSSPPYEARLDGRRLSGAALVGLAVGLAPIWVAVEISGRYFSLEGNLRRAEVRAHADIDGVSIEPAGAVFARF